ncbi:S-adenosyl-L-methionine-dependent methyltransferase [Backusella circina FSU 941]|nr:S-adenosyl-L-methionine-dependent methyltransferase [Backusella circina FSU 941]KAI8887948.1 S-adenosyl-L-methionine-dependent methyltransferase [Backusella circina FSU 941]
MNKRQTPPRSFSEPILSNGSQTTIDGRKYQTLSNKYCLPVDEIEQDRLTNTHYVLKYCFGNNFSAPIHDMLSRSVSVSGDSNNSIPQLVTEKTNGLSECSSISSSSSSLKTMPTPKQDITPARVLDTACGSGVWVLEMATEFPNAQFYGVDMVPLYPNDIKPPNSSFQQVDVLEGLPFPDEYFDYVHMRLVYNCFSNSNIKFVIGEICRVLKPGGYIEMRDLDPVIKNPGPVSSSVFGDYTARMNQLHSIDVTWTQRLCELFSNQSEITDIHHQTISMQFDYAGPVATSIDRCTRDAISCQKQFFMSAFSFTSEKCEEVFDAVMREGKEYNSYFNYYQAWGRKPLVPVDYYPNTPLAPLSTFQPCGTELSSPSNSSSIENTFDIYQFSSGFVE